MYASLVGQAFPSLASIDPGDRYGMWHFHLGFTHWRGAIIAQGIAARDALGQVSVYDGWLETLGALKCTWCT